MVLATGTEAFGHSWTEFGLLSLSRSGVDESGGAGDSAGHNSTFEKRAAA